MTQDKYPLNMPPVENNSPLQEKVEYHSIIENNDTIVESNPTNMVHDGQTVNIITPKAPGVVSWVRVILLVVKMMMPIIWKSLKPFILIGIVSGSVHYALQRYENSKVITQINTTQKNLPPK